MAHLSGYGRDSVAAGQNNANRPTRRSYCAAAPAHDTTSAAVRHKPSAAGIYSATVSTDGEHGQVSLLWLAGFAYGRFLPRCLLDGSSLARRRQRALCRRCLLGSSGCRHLCPCHHLPLRWRRRFRRGGSSPDLHAPSLQFIANSGQRHSADNGLLAIGNIIEGNEEG